jgi:hypothetical protein
VRQGFSTIRLYTNETMVEALAFYAALGYVEDHREPRGGTDVVHFRKDLSAPP